jgi:hypothetical protein
MLEGVPTRCREGGLQRFRPLTVNPPQTWSAVRFRLRSTLRNDWRIDRIQELLTYLDR